MRARVVCVCVRVCVCVCVCVCLKVPREGWEVSSAWGGGLFESRCFDMRNTTTLWAEFRKLSNSSEGVMGVRHVSTQRRCVDSVFAVVQ